MLKTSLTLRPSGRLDAWRRQFDAKEDEMVVAAARGGRGHGLEQPERLALAARHLRMATRARPSGELFRRHGWTKRPGVKSAVFVLVTTMAIGVHYNQVILTKHSQLQLPRTRASSES